MLARAAQAASAGLNPPRFERCVSRATRSAAAARRTPPDQAVLRAACRNQYRARLTNSFTAVVQHQWAVEAARAAGLATGQAGPQAIAPDLTSDPLVQKLLIAAVRRAGAPSTNEIATFYQRNKRSFSQPARAAVEVVLTETRADAAAAADQLAAGKPIAAVRSTYSHRRELVRAATQITTVAIDQASQSLITVDPEITRAAMGVPAAAVARHSRAAVAGPRLTADAIWSRPADNGRATKAARAWFALRVVRLLAPHQETLREATARIRQLLTLRKRGDAQQSFLGDFQRTWRARTRCARIFWNPQVCGATNL